MPVFSRDEDRLAFEEHLNKVDLSCVDHLYTQHQVAQEITCLPGARLAPKEVCDLHVFSCNVCKKVRPVVSAANLRDFPLDLGISLV